jgi:carboxypeptidase C (cathepsin A)
MQTSFGCVAMLACAMLCAVFPSESVAAQTDKPAAAADKAAAPDKAAAADKTALSPLPAEAHVQQSMQLDGKTLKYTVTVGSISTRDKDGKAAGDVVVTAYAMEGDNRPVTFAVNGGPGAASVFLNFGAIGPKHLQAGNEGDSPSDPTLLKDNPGTWIDFTDLVFIDPVHWIQPRYGS